MGEAARKRGLFCALTNHTAPPANRKASASIQRPSLGMDHTHERIMQQLEEDGDFNAEGIEAVRALTRHP